MDQRQELRDFLLSRRARITPQQAGLPQFGTSDRRVPGLRRSELALLANVSVEYLTKLERGNATGVSDILACGDEEMIRARLASFEAAGVTDVSVRVLPIGDGREALLESSRRTRNFIAVLAAERAAERA